MKGITLECLPASLRAPEGSLTEQALWYQRQLEEMAPVRQYVTYCHEQVESAWNLLQARLHETQRKLVEVKQLPPAGKKRRGRSRRKNISADVMKAIEKMALTEEQKKQLLEILG